ncbi:2-amino-4-hydroxy-6-hydroxymethyldihydropteridinepyrophosphokinase [Hartmannibacter diazotrophicus]|uniref:2-amino-4-hydroxy-6-hydroxymethyldihydropteridine pyrophosphokinase n=1 Tax=Hartmannibacter diazotrophicus TaxID=1482074 RepID=A0A2C9D6M0_9HYPH|nr:2-amino-4-hydroxy-6-hydroxymethyldihydropteridine diphosphokinase [Hartmannibacter diazotrophicus]SON55840.1 2-amino-4-hydroxy-6-hydroxymethyldihydropteridinepyrophosphokinase [Hartmannibacter diazotrophicus]
MAKAYLGLGGNIGDARANIAAALDALDANGAKVIKRSGDYETPPWGKLDQPPYINACAIVETELTPKALLALCLDTERELGRIRIEKWGPRVIDIDLLAYENEVIDDPSYPALNVPHPYMLDRAFVLVPLAEIAPDLEVKGVKVSEAVKSFDASEIKRIV